MWYSWGVHGNHYYWFVGISVCNVKDSETKLADFYDANVYIYRNKSPYIRVEFKDGLLIYNDKNSSDTEKNYEKLVEIVNINKYKK